MKLFLPIALLLLAACSPVYKLAISQGNVIDDEKLAQLELGMTRQQVRYLMGTPLIATEFAPNRWDYVAYYRSSEGKERRRTLSLFFDGDALARMQDTDPPEDSEPTADTAES